MPRVKQASKQKSTTKAAAVTVLGATGLGFSLLDSASASTMPAADIAQSDNTPPNQRFVLSEEEMADVSLATFHLLDKENVGSGVQLAARGGCRGCAARGCRGCAPWLPWLRSPWLPWLRGPWLRGPGWRSVLRGRLRGRQLLRILGILPRVLSPTT